jgi:polysaccharide biosynthesis protein PslH
MKNILYLTHIFPYPPNEGGRIATYNLLKELSNYGHNIHLCSFISQDEFNNELQFKIDIPLSSIEVIIKDYSNSFVNIFKNLFDTKAYTTSKYIDSRMKDKIIEIIKNKNIEILYCDHLHTAYYGLEVKKKFPEITVLLREHNVESQILYRASQEEKSLVKKLFLRYQYYKLKNYEINTVERFDKVFMISNDDKEYLYKHNNKVNLEVLQAGVDTNRYFPSIKKVNKQTQKKNTLLFLGTMSWLPNIDGVAWFLDNIFPKILKKYPQTIFYVVGKNPPEKILNYKSIFPDNLVITGFVEDERDYIREADVFLVPLRIGSGIRIKILIALAMRKTIVTTSIGIEGIDIDRNSIYLANSPDEFIQSIQDIFDNKEKAAAKAELGYREVINKYSNKVIYSQHAADLDKLN